MDHKGPEYSDTYRNDLFSFFLGFFLQLIQYNRLIHIRETKLIDTERGIPFFTREEERTTGAYSFRGGRKRRKLERMTIVKTNCKAFVERICETSYEFFVPVFHLEQYCFVYTVTVIQSDSAVRNSNLKLALR